MSAHPTVSPAKPGRVELTVRGLILGALITLVFTAANIYVGLKAGLTFASSIPAAVISMAVLRWFKNATIYENNIVQTVASAAGTLSSVIFILPSLIIVGWWDGFPFWQSFGVCLVGGVLGVMYTVPLRRGLVTQSDLPYPEGVAAAEVLKVGARDGSNEPTAEAVAENRDGLFAVVWGSVASAVLAVIVATKAFVGEVAGYFRVGAGATGMSGSVSLALVGAGHLVGLAVGIAILVGLVLAWGVATPLLTALQHTPGAAADAAVGVWKNQVRLIGAGAIGIAGIWTLLRLARPVVTGIVSSLAASRAARASGRETLPITEQDIPITTVALVSLVAVIPIAILLVAFLSGTVIASMTVPLVIGAIVYITIAGFLVATAAGYMAGLIGSSNSPISGLAILTVIGASFLLLALAHNAPPGSSPSLVAFALFVTAIVLAVATIANDNLQDLKTGQLVDATPWRQQVSLVVGVLAGALVIPPILVLLNYSNGFVGAPTHHAIAAPLAAPQANLLALLAKGVIGGQINWGLIGIGALAGVVIIVIDEVLRATGKFKLPPLAVGLGIYLPTGATFPVVIGAFIGHFYNRWAQRTSNPGRVQRLGVLFASGLIVGESLLNVVLSGIIALTQNPAPIGFVPDSFAPVANVLGAIGLAGFLVVGYLWVGRLGTRNRV